ncbi:MAG TPA: Uma2 family endonuclease [Terriglobia bacterium]|nr:Uma2 family endonuclease [Terriglobia bacterium]
MPRANSDRTLSAALYAQTGIREVWIADLNQDAVHVHRNPQGQTYTSIETRRRGESVSPEAFPDFSIAVEDLLG